MPKKALKTTRDQRRSVFLAHGWDSRVEQRIVTILGKIGLRVISWEELVEQLGKPSPFTLEVVKRALDNAMVVVVLFTPDESIATADHLNRNTGDADSVNLSEFQVRPNVLIETGMSLAINDQRTVIVVVGAHRPISDLDGLNVVRTGDRGWAARFAQRLKVAFDNTDEPLILSEVLLNDLKQERRILRSTKVVTQTMIRKPSGLRRVGKKKMVPSCKLADDPVNRRQRLIEVFEKFGGTSSAKWRFDTNAPDYMVMKEAEELNQRTPIPNGSNVLIQQHYESEYNGKIGKIVARKGPTVYRVVFDDELGLAEKNFHVMYLSKCV